MENAELDRLRGKNWVATFLFCCFLGCFGAHRFYTGKQTTAWVMFALSILGLSIVSGIWSFVDLMIIIFGDFRHQDGSELYERKNWLGYLYIAFFVLIILGVILTSMIFSAMISAAMAGATTAAAVSAAGAPSGF